MTMQSIMPRTPARSGDEMDWISKRARRVLGLNSGRFVKRSLNRRERRTARLALTAQE